MNLQLIAARIMARTSRGDRGATAVEYGLIVALIAVIIIVAVALLGNNLRSTFETVATSVAP